MRETTAALAQVTDLMALVTRRRRGYGDDPPGRGAASAADRVMVVVIASTGASPSASSTSRPVDPGLVEWASSYLNESLAG